MGFIYGFYIYTAKMFPKDKIWKGSIKRIQKDIEMGSIYI